MCIYIGIYSLLTQPVFFFRGVLLAVTALFRWGDVLTTFRGYQWVGEKAAGIYGWFYGSKNGGFHGIFNGGFQ